MKKPFLLLFFVSCFLSHLYSQDLRSDTLDLKSYLLNIDLTDFTTQILKGSAQIGVKAKLNNVNGIRLDLLKLNVDSVTEDGNLVPYTYNDTTLEINFLSTYNTGDSFTLKVYYRGHPYQQFGDFGGFYWNATYAFNIGVTFLNEPHNYGRVWFPCFDNFRQRSLFEFNITTKNIHKAFCNGNLIGVTSIIGNKKLWNWKLNQEIPSYLASVNVGAYATVFDTVMGINGTKEIQLAALSTDTTTLKNLYVHLHDAFHIYENLFGAYEWDRIGYCINSFTGGGMEHATNIGMASIYMGVASGKAETTMAHELSHHWFGNLVTCDSASEMWLNEGWARYCEHLFLEKLYNDSTYRTAVHDLHDKVVGSVHLLDGAYLPVSGVPSLATYSSTVYDKGADVIHTLRWYLGDSIFFHCLKNYIADFKWQNVSTAQFRDYLAICAGKNLSDYFDDWIYAPGFPHFSIEHSETISNGTTFETTVDIRQRISHAPHLYNHVPVTVSYFDMNKNRVKQLADVSGECTQIISPALLFNPVYIALDFDEKIQDAISDEWKIISDTGSLNFGTARMNLHVNSIADSVLIRIEHNWISADDMFNPIQGLHLNDNRYWTVDGTFDFTLSASATINYNGNSYPDQTFFTNTEDSLVLMFRPNQESDWSIDNTAILNSGANLTDKIGFITISNLKKGEYAMAIWNSALLTDTNHHLSCAQQVGISEVKEENDFLLYPNPANNFIKAEFTPNTFTEAKVFDVTGRRISEQKIAVLQNSLQLNISHLQSGIYFLTLKQNSGRERSARFIKQ